MKKHDEMTEDELERSYGEYLEGEMRHRDAVSETERQCLEAEEAGDLHAMAHYGDCLAAEEKMAGEPEDPEDAIGRDDYRYRQVERADRMEERARKLRAEAERLEQSNRVVLDAMNGTPVLVGHHSERRHRRDLDQVHRRTGKAIENRRRADELERRAERVGALGISQDDPEALVELRAKIAELEEDHEAMKSVNAAWRKAKRPLPNDGAGWGRVAELVGRPLESFDQLRIDLARFGDLHRGGNPTPYSLSNHGANLRRYRQRLAELEAEAARRRKGVAEPIEGERDGIAWKIVERVDLNRITVVFSERVPKAWYQRMRLEGFRWMRSEECFSRHLNDAGRHAAKRATSAIASGAV